MIKPFKFSSSPRPQGPAARPAPARALALTLLLTLGVLLLPAPRAGAVDPVYRDRNYHRSLFSDNKAVEVGDLLSIIVQENNSATKDVSTKTAKKSTADTGIDKFLFSPAASGLLTKGGAFPGLKFSSANDFDGSGSVNNSEKIVARLQVMVKDVLPNGNMIVEGRRQTSFSGESQDMVIRGIVRRADVTPANSVFSYQVHDASIQIVSKGAASNSAKKGWFNKVWDKVNPF
ncbi:MAG TPA: hypothetical protein DCM86_03700 [Verrucomicrobiales bacterium]|nr:hypothetical protein [Verrucomicrobiales bacterium]